MRKYSSRIRHRQLRSMTISDQDVLRRQRLDGLLELAEIVRKRTITDEQYSWRLKRLGELVEQVDLRSREKLP